MRTNVLNDLSNVVKKEQAWLVLGVRLDGCRKEHPMSIR